MDWLFEHISIKLLLFIGGGIAYLVSKVREMKLRRDAEEFDREQRMLEKGGLAAHGRVDSTQAQADERTRRIQEEIRRKILERQRSRETRPASPLEAPRPIASPLAPPRAARRLEPPSLPAVGTSDEILAKQREMVEALRAIDEQKTAASRRRTVEAMVSGAEGTEAVYAKTAVAAVNAQRLLGDLKDRQQLRRAVVLREVLGAPVALR